MDAGQLVLLAVKVLAAANWGLHYYTHQVTYRLFPVVAAAGGGPGFVRYHQAYEKRLPVSIYVPWSLLVAGSVLLVVVRPDGLGVGWPLLLLGLNLAIAVLSVLVAAPVHRRVDAEGALSSGAATMLVRANGVRLAVASLSLLVTAGLAWAYLA